MAVAVTIGGVDKTTLVDRPSLRITWSSNYRTVADFITVDRAASSPYRPTIADTVTIVDGETTLFAGIVQSLDVERVRPNAGARCRVSCVDYSAYPNYRVVRSQSFAAGQNTKQVISSLTTTYLSEWSVAVDAGMANGTTLPAMAFDGRMLDDVLTELAGAEGWIWEIVDVTGTKTLKAYAPGATGAPASFTESDTALQDATWSQRRDDGGYANRVIVRWGAGSDEVSSDSSATTDPREVLLTAPDIPNATQAAALGASQLARRLTTGKEVRCVTTRAGYLPGQSVTINLPALGVDSATYYIREVTCALDEGYRIGTLYYEVVCVLSTGLPGDWREFYAERFGGYGSASVAALVGASATQGRTYYLGGSRNIGVKHSAVTNAPDYIEVVLDSTWFSGATVTAQVEVKTDSAGTSVQPQVWNVTDASQAGIGSATTATSWEAQSFTITLAAGTKRYRLRLIPSNASALVYGVGALYAT